MIDSEIEFPFIVKMECGPIGRNSTIILGVCEGVEIYVWRLTSGDECPDVDYSCVNLKFSVETSDYLKFYFSFDAIYEKHYLRSQSGKNHHIY